MLYSKAGWQLGVLAGAFSLAFSVGAGAQPRVMVDGKMVRGPQSYTVGGNVMVPVRGVIDRIKGARVQYVPAQREILVMRAGTTITLHLSSGYAQVNGEGVPIGTPVVVRDGQALMPLRFVSQVLGAKVSYDPRRQLASISSPKGAWVMGYRSTPDEWQKDGSIAIGGVRLVKLETKADAASLAERADQATGRLNRGLTSLNEHGGWRADGVWVDNSQADPSVCVGRVPVIKVTPEDARAAGMSQQQLAQEWMRQMRAGLTRIYGRR